MRDSNFGRLVACYHTRKDFEVASIQHQTFQEMIMNETQDST